MELEEKIEIRVSPEFKKMVNDACSKYKVTISSMLRLAFSYFVKSDISGKLKENLKKYAEFIFMEEYNRTLKFMFKMNKREDRMIEDFRKALQRNIDKEDMKGTNDLIMIALRYPQEDIKKKFMKIVQSYCPHRVKHCITALKKEQKLLKGKKVVKKEEIDRMFRGFLEERDYGSKVERKKNINKEIIDMSKGELNYFVDKMSKGK